MTNKLKKQILKEIEEISYYVKYSSNYEIYEILEDGKLYIGLTYVEKQKISEYNLLKAQLEILNKVEVELEGKVDKILKLIEDCNSDGYQEEDGNITYDFCGLIEKVKEIFGDKK